MKTCLAPTTLGLTPSIGLGDRLGRATPGHVAALQEAGGPIRGIFAQQSIREMTRTRRSPAEVMQAAVDALTALDYAEDWSADADHLKTEADVDACAAAGFVFFTLDPSDDVDQHADSYDETMLAAKYAAVRDSASWVEQYRGRTMRMAAGTITFDGRSLQRAVVKYGRAIARATDLARCMAAASERHDRPYEIELSIDETAEPTTPAEHVIIAEQLAKAGVRLTSLAPRFLGDFEKGVDFKGDLAALEASLRLHAEIAREFGPYKLSLHSGSDKLSMYPALARATGGRFHVKTAGTSWLEALRVVAHRDEALFRRVIDFARGAYDRDKATYHVSATLAATPATDEVTDPEILEQLYLDRWNAVRPGCGFTEPGRQILHCTFGSIISDAALGPAIIGLIDRHPDDYVDVLRQHFVRHLQALAPGEKIHHRVHRGHGE